MDGVKSYPSCVTQRLQMLRAELDGYMPVLDGLRGLAILLVIAHNLGIPSLSQSEAVVVKAARLFTNAGWIGVQLFFVLSGFLITGMLVDEKNARKLSVFRQISWFYMRRVLRIFPLYYVALIAAFIILPQFFEPVQWLEGAREHARWYWFFASNWGYAWYELGGGFAHFWSLAVEEQFYLFWPFIVIFASTRSLAKICFAMIAIAVMFRIGLVIAAPEFAEKAAYTFTIARVDAIGIGALLSLMIRTAQGVSWLEKYAMSFLIVGLILVLAISMISHNFAPVVVIEDPRDWLCLFNQTIAAIVSAAFLYVVLASPAAGCLEGRVAGITKRFLTWKHLCAVGKYSFAIYVIHMPIINIWLAMSAGYAIAEKTGPLFAALINMSVVFFSSLVFALISWHVLEKQFLSLKVKFSPKKGSLQTASFDPLRAE